MFQELKIKAIGQADLLMHNIQLADPLNQFAKDLKKITRKQKKTEQDHAEMGNLEFMGGLYLNDKGQPVAPPNWWEGTLLNAAKKKRMGPVVKAAVFCDQEATLKFAGPKKVEKRAADPSCRLATMVTVQKAKVKRTRPLFQQWSCVVVLQYDPEQINKQDVVDLMDLAGRQIGVGDWRPKYGRFTIEVID